MVMGVLSSVLAKLTVLVDAVSEQWIGINGTPGSECSLDWTVQVSVLPCGEQIVTFLASCAGLVTGYVMPPLLSLMHGASYTQAGP